MNEPSKDVDAYIAQFSGETKKRLEQVRAIFHEVAPDAVESVSYAIVGYKLNGKPIGYFGGYAHHVGFYATPSGNEAFTKELSTYKQGRGSVQLPHTQPLPVDLIRRMVAYNAAAQR